MGPDRGLDGRARRTIRLLQVATGISGIGDGVVLAAFPLLAARLTDDPRLVVAVTVAARLPWLIVGLPAGALVDRADRRRLVTVVETGRALALLALSLTIAAESGELVALIATAFLVGVGETIMISAVHASVPELVPPEHLARTNGSLFALQVGTENLIGPAIGGALFAVAAALPFLVDGVSFVAAAVVLSVAMAGMHRRPAPATDTSFRTEIAHGLRYFARSPVLRRLGALVAALAFCQAMVFGPLVLFALDGLGLSDAGYGLLLGIAAIGNIVGGAVAGRLDLRLGPRVVLPASALLASAAYAVCGLATTVVVAAAALAVEAVAVALGNVASLTLRQRLIPNDLQGRVGNVMRFFIFGAAPIGALAGGVLVQQFGVRAPFAGAAALQLLAVAIVAPSFVRALPVTVSTAA